MDAPSTQEKETENYEFFNGFGAFACEGREYEFCWRVITDRRHPGLMLFQIRTLASRYRSRVRALPGVSTAGKIRLRLGPMTP